MKKKRKQFNKKTASRNALTTKEPKRRFGKKQKRKLIIITSVALALFIALSFVGKYYQNKKIEEENKAKKGKLIELNADKKEFNEDGNEIEPRTSTEIHVLNVGDANAVLVKKGHQEVLIDAGSDKIIKYLSKHIDGDLDYVVTTSENTNSIDGLKKVNDKFNIKKYIYNNYATLRINGERANNQVIDLGENLSLALSSDNGHDHTIVTITDNEYRIFVVGEAGENTPMVSEGFYGTLAYIMSGKPNISNISIETLRTLNPQYCIVSTGTKLSTDFIKKITENSSQLFSTYKSKTIVLTIGAEEVTTNLNYDDQLTMEMDSEEDQNKIE